MPQKKSRASHGGRVILVGAGPGDPELITVKGLKALKEADVVVYDRLVSRELLEHVKDGAELVYAGKEPGKHTLTQEEINQILVDKAMQGLTVVRLKGGDPLVYGRGEEECLYVRSFDIPCEIIPGIPSFVGGSAEYLVPLGSRGYSRVFSVVTGTTMGDKPVDHEKMKKLLEASDTVVILMGARWLRDILSIAAEVRGRDEAVVLIRNATHPDSHIIAGSIGDLIDRGVQQEPPLLIYIGGGARWLIEKVGVQR
ncbi:MAG: uroporphyrinogen-III C-methyltransferase [Desulfurococcales archaeon]|nr:uroporphyrinogen-III C-methyltransferase [Desulfurococcales archaeon]MCE4622404.1 uroporphyrinogen-III C-methyltransferase [Desulfurococcales archaeon]MCE4627362.1 uroporphyrinogen-III C-methyltransferase [Desulfurococcales archaeon]MCE4629050.1 uroporphyrinogen-III C-methyltransferase [Desulfurococcales archaeon]